MVKFKSERRAGSQAGLGRNGSTFRNAYGQRYPIEYARNANKSRDEDLVAISNLLGTSRILIKNRMAANQVQSLLPVSFC